MIGRAPDGPELDADIPAIVEEDVAAIPVEPPVIPEEDPVPDVYESISLYVLSGDPEAAIAAYRAAELEDPDDPATRVLLGNLMIAAGALDDAVRLFDSVIESDPDNIDAMFARALLAGHFGNRALQEQLLMNVVTIDPENARGHAAIGEMLLQQRRLDRAAEAFQKSATIDPENVVAHVGLGNVQLRRERYQEAKTSFTRAIEIEPDSPFVYVDRSRALVRLYELDAAHRDLDRAIDLEPDFAWNYVDRGRLRAEMGQFDDSIEDFNRAIESLPDVFLLYVYRARVLDRVGRRGAAIEDFETALAMNPEYYPALAPLGTLYYIENRWGEAAQAFRDAYRHNRNEHAFGLLTALSLGRTDGGIAGARRYMRDIVNDMPRDSLEYHVGRAIVESGYDAIATRRVNDERDPFRKARMTFYLAAYYDLIERTRLAQTLYLEVERSNYPGLIETRLAAERLREFRRDR